MDWVAGCSLGIWAERLAYLPISDLLSRPECRMTARKRPWCLETCLYLCISHINKFSHRCIQTNLSALLHTNTQLPQALKHPINNHSKRETERERGKPRRGGRTGESKGRKEGWRWRTGDIETGGASGETLKWKCWGEASAPELCSAFCLAEQEPPKSETPSGVDKREIGSGGMRNKQGVGVGGGEDFKDAWNV